MLEYKGRMKTFLEKLDKDEVNGIVLLRELMRSKKEVECIEYDKKLLLPTTEEVLDSAGREAESGTHG